MFEQQSTIAPGAQPYFLPGGQKGILCIHGLGGSGDDFRQAAQLLHERGWTVSVMRVAGHGMTWREAAASHVPDWRDSVDQALLELRSSASTILVLGSSFGGALALDLAARSPHLLDGLVSLNTPLSYRVGGAFQTIGLHLLKIVSPVFPKPGLTAADKEKYKTSGSLPAWPISLILESKKFLQETVRPQLSSIRLPLLRIENANDPYIGQESGTEIDSQYGGPITPIYLSTVTHRPFRDREQTQRIVEEIIRFAEQLPEHQ